jgi:hypothetical protein
MGRRPDGGCCGENPTQARRRTLAPAKKLNLVVVSTQLHGAEVGPAAAQALARRNEEPGTTHTEENRETDPNSIEKNLGPGPAARNVGTGRRCDSGRRKTGTQTRPTVRFGKTRSGGAAALGEAQREMAAGFGRAENSQP